MRNYIRIEIIIWYIVYLLITLRKKERYIIGIIIILINHIIYSNNYFKLWIYIELINILTYFLLIHKKRIINIIMLYFFFNIFSSLYFIVLLLSNNPNFKYFFYYKLGVFPFNIIIYNIYKYQTYSNLLYLSYFPKYLYLTLINTNKNIIAIRKYNIKYFNLYI